MCMGNCTAVTVDAHALVATAITAVLERSVCLLNVVCVVLEVDSDSFKFGHGYYLRYGHSIVKAHNETHKGLFPLWT